MSFWNLLADHYYIHADHEIFYDGYKGYGQDNSLYFITTMENREIFTMEQIILSHFLKENGYNYMALPIQNKEKEWFTTWENDRYIVSSVEELQSESLLTPGEALAYFHEIGITYPYQPQEISSYGKWKDLWIYKLTAYEERAKQEQDNFRSHFNEYIWDIFPYIIGLTENAIQYVGETNVERRYHEADQGTITFKRYTGQLEEPILWSHDLFYDHPARDIAEAIRLMYLNEAPNDEIVRFLKDYEAVRPLSIFSWRLIYARLIFPAHLFDALENLYKNPEDAAFEKFVHLTEGQDRYEDKLRHFFDYSSINAYQLDIPMLNWL